MIPWAPSDVSAPTRRVDWWTLGLLLVLGTPLNAQSPHHASIQITAGTLDWMHSPILRADLRVLGAQSCAAASCHGGPRPGVAQPSAARGSEYSLWLERDPHANSWQTMCSNASTMILRRLKILDRQGSIIDRAGYDNCLACHNTIKRFDEPRLDLSAHQSPGEINSLQSEGVGCSGCHGPSERWISTHYQYYWNVDSANHDGFVATGDLFVRARMCASCHVGDKDRDMNHDIIAAGHPPLRYQFAAYHRRLPKHWRDAEAADRDSYDPQLWLAGQVAAADANLALLQSRANKSLGISVWPELSAYDCQSCHHEIGKRPVRRGRTRGTARFAADHQTGLRQLTNHRVVSGEATDLDYELIAALNQIKQIMESAAVPNAAEVAAAAVEARLTLARWLAGPGTNERTVMRTDRLVRIASQPTIAPPSGAVDEQLEDSRFREQLRQLQDGLDARRKRTGDDGRRDNPDPTAAEPKTKTPPVPEKDPRQRLDELEKDFFGSDDEGLLKQPDRQ